MNGALGSDAKNNKNYFAPLGIEQHGDGYYLVNKSTNKLVPLGPFRTVQEAEAISTQRFNGPEIFPAEALMVFKDRKDEDGAITSYKVPVEDQVKEYEIRKLTEQHRRQQQGGMGHAPAGAPFAGTMEQIPRR